MVVLIKYMKKWIIITLLAVICIGVWRIDLSDTDKPESTSKTNISKKNSSQSEIPKPFDKQRHSLSDPSSIWGVVNKLRPLSPINYVPADLTQPDVAFRKSSDSPEMTLRKTAASALEQLFAGAEKDSFVLALASGY